MGTCCYELTILFCLWTYCPILSGNLCLVQMQMRKTDVHDAHDNWTSGQGHKAPMLSAGGVWKGSGLDLREQCSQQVGCVGFGFRFVTGMLCVLAASFPRLDRGT